MSYDNDSYLQALAGHRESITRNIENTIAEVNRQTQLGQDQAKLIPGAAQGAADTAARWGHGTNRVMGQAADRLNLGHVLDETRQGITAGLDRAADRIGSAWGGAAGLIGQGFEERGAQQRGRVSLIGQQLYADNDMGRANYVAGRQAEDRDRAFQQDQANRQREFDTWAIGEQARLERERIASEAAENQRNRDWQTGEARLNQLGAALGVNPLSPQPLQQTVGSMFLQYGGLPPGYTVEDVAAITGQPVEAVAREILVANERHNNKRPTTGAF